MYFSAEDKWSVIIPIELIDLNKCLPLLETNRQMCLMSYMRKPKQNYMPNLNRTMLNAPSNHNYLNNPNCLIYLQTISWQEWRKT